MQEYKLLQSDTTLGLERMVIAALNEQGMTLYGNPMEFGGRKVQAVIKGAPIDGGGQSIAGMTGGLFYYDSTLPAYEIQGGTWDTFKNNSDGPLTDLRFAPDGVTSMLDPSTGRIVLSGLAVGDQVYIRHVLTLLAYVNNTEAWFQHVIGSGSELREVPFGQRVRLSSGAGVTSEPFSVETQLYVSSENIRDAGILPQIKATGRCDVGYKGLYISVVRRPAS